LHGDIGERSFLIEVNIDELKLLKLYNIFHMELPSFFLQPHLLLRVSNISFNFFAQHLHNIRDHSFPNPALFEVLVQV
jgi:hypothetical protein